MGGPSGREKREVSIGRLRQGGGEGGRERASLSHRITSSREGRSNAGISGALQWQEEGRNERRGRERQGKTEGKGKGG